VESAREPGGVSNPLEDLDWDCHLRWGVNRRWGLGMAFRKRRGFYIAAVAALVMLLFPSMSRLFPAKAYAFEDLSLVDFGVVAVVGLSASLAWMFWPK
jgi:hypothetical protein